MRLVARLASAVLALSLALTIPAWAADISSSHWSETDSSNNHASPNGWTSGTMLPSQVEPTARGMMGAIKRFYNHINGTITSGGTANVQTLTYSIAPAAYVTGDAYSFKVGATNTGATTLNVNSLGAEAVQLNGAALTGGELAVGAYVTVVYDGTQFQISSNGRFPAPGGDIRNFGCKVDGSTDDTTCAQAAIAWAQANGGTIWQTPGIMIVKSGVLAITASNISWRCLAGGSSFHTSGTTAQSPCMIKWGGVSAPSGGYIMTVLAPTGATTDTYLQGIHIVDISFNGNGVANGALSVATVLSSEFRNIHAQAFISNNSDHVFSFGVVSATGSTFGEPNVVTQRTEIRNLTCDGLASTSYNAPCFIFTGGVAPAQLPGDASLLEVFDLTCLIAASSTNCLDLNGDDNNTFHNVTAQMPSSSPGSPIHFGVLNSGSTYFGATSDRIVGFSSNGYGFITSDGTETGCVFGNFGFSSCPSLNSIEDIDGVNSGLQNITCSGNGGICIDNASPAHGVGVRPFIDLTWSFKGNLSMPAVSWTPTFSCLTGSLGTAPTVNNAVYFKQGSSVHATIDVTMGTIGTCGGALLTTLPILADTAHITMGGTWGDETNSNNTLTGVVNSSLQVASVHGNGVLGIGGGDQVRFTFVYNTNF